MAANSLWPRFVRTGAITVTPGFSVSRTSAFFVIGSCFATNIRHQLDLDGFLVHPVMPADLIDHVSSQSYRMPQWSKWDGSTHLQVYHTWSIRQEFEKALGAWQQSPDDYWTVTTKTGQTCVQDPYRRQIFADSPEHLARITTLLDTAMRVGIAQSDVIIMTLGLIEAWRTGSGRYAACEPGYNGGGGHHETTLDVLDYETNLENLRATFDQLFARYPDKRVILTVSPVPLRRTYRGLDIVTANTESKSILRAVAARIVAEYDRIDYFPSYEIVLNTPGGFQQDLRHVTTPTVSRVIEQFTAAYVEGGAADATRGQAEQHRATIRIGMLQQEVVFADGLRDHIKLASPEARAMVDALLDAYQAFGQAHRSPRKAADMLDRVHVGSRGAFTGLIARQLARLFPAPAIPAHSSMLPALTAAAADSLGDAVRTEGFQHVPGAIPDALRTRLLQDCTGDTGIDGSDDCDPGWGVTGRSQALLSLIADAGLQRLCGRALRTVPILDTVTLPAAAEQPDRKLGARKARFCQVGVAVGLAPGLHRVRFVAGSHLDRPASLWRPGEIAPEELAAVTVAAVPLAPGDLLLWQTDLICDMAPLPGVVQFTFSSSLFGRPTVSEPLTRPLREAILAALAPLDDRSKLAVL